MSEPEISEPEISAPTPSTAASPHNEGTNAASVQELNDLYVYYSTTVHVA